MRVLFLTRPGDLRNPVTISKYARATIKHMLAADPELYVLWVIPTGTPDEALWSYVGSLTEQQERRLKFLPVQAALSERTSGYFLTEGIWRELTQTRTSIAYDVVLNQQPAMTMLYSTLLWNRYQASRYNVSVPIVNLQQWTATDGQVKTNPEYYAGEADLIAETVSSSFATNVWEGHWLYEDHLKTAVRYVQPSVIRAIKSKSVVVHNGVAVDQLRQTERSGPPVLFWGGRLADQKQPEASFDVMQEVQTLTGCRVIVCTQSGEKEASWVAEKHEAFELHTNVGQEQWYGLISQGSVFVCNSKVEGYGAAWLEMLASGQLGVFMEEPWQKGWLPEWYPFVVTDLRAQIEMTAALIKTWPDESVWETSTRIVDWVDEEHNDRKQALLLSDVLTKAKAQGIAQDMGKARGSVGKLLHLAAMSVAEEMEDPIPEELIYERVGKLSTANREWGKPGDLVSRMYLRRLLEGNGWRDVCQSERVEFVRPGA